MSYLIFDFGGTSTKYGVLNQQGEICFKSEDPAARSLEGMLDHIETVYEKTTLAYGNVRGVGMSIPAVTDADAGCVTSEGALKYVKNINLRQLVEERLHRPVEIENDGNCAALAEAYAGAGVSYSSLAVVVCGTGIGGALIENKAIKKGANLHGGEFGYGIMVYDAQASRIGTWSEQGSVAALVSRVMAQKGDAHALSGRDIFDRADLGDAVSIKEIERFYILLAMGIHNIQYSIDPEIILLGGGISRRPDFVKSIEAKLDIIYEQLDNATVRPHIDTCAHFNDANLIGAYYNLIHRRKI